jgi:hypothetical protein
MKLSTSLMMGTLTVCLCAAAIVAAKFFLIETHLEDILDLDIASSVPLIK